MNGWGNEKPAEYLACLQARGTSAQPTTSEQGWHRAMVTRIPTGRCSESYTCSVCGINWAVDSSD